MYKKDLIIGLLLGILAALLGTITFILLFIDAPFFEAINSLKRNNYLGKVIALGTIFDLILFSLLLKKNKEMMAKGVIASVIVLALFTLII